NRGRWSARKPPTMRPFRLPGWQSFSSQPTCRLLCGFLVGTNRRFAPTSDSHIVAKLGQNRICLVKIITNTVLLQIIFRPLRILGLVVLPQREQCPPLVVGHCQLLRVSQRFLPGGVGLVWLTRKGMIPALPQPGARLSEDDDPSVFSRQLARFSQQRRKL